MAKPPQAAAAQLTYKQRREMAEWLVSTFRPERFVYLALSIVAFVFLVILGVFQLLEKDWKSLLALFGPAGLFTFSLMQLFQVWNKTVAILLGAAQEPKE